MKKLTPFFLLLNLLAVNVIYSQVGINTTSPKGILDIESTTQGVVYPSASLTSLTTQTIDNPHPVNTNLESGTTIYNTNTAEDGINSVYPGLYTWNATTNKYISKFFQKDFKICTQNSDLRTESDLTNQAISFDDNSFTPLYSGRYKIEITVHFGAGTIRNPNSGYYVNFAAQSGEYNFTFNGNSTTFTLHSYSGKNRDDQFVGSGVTKNYRNTYTQITYVIEENLTRGVTYPFTLDFSQDAAPDFGNNGNQNNGRGYITSQNDLDAVVEFSFVGE